MKNLALQSCFGVDFADNIVFASPPFPNIGYVHTDIKGGGRPGMVQVKLAQSMLMKKNLKKTRQEHPLFARGFDSKLRMEISEKGLFVALPAGESKSSKEECLMNQSMNKIAFVSSIGKTLYVMMKSTSSGRLVPSPAPRLSVCPTPLPPSHGVLFRTRMVNLASLVRPL